MATYVYSIIDSATGEFSDNPEDQGFNFEFPCGKAPETFEKDGKTFKKDFSFWGAGGQHSSTYPRLCDASAVTPGAIKGFQDWGRKHGIDLEFTPEGRAIYRDKAHERKCLAFRGMYQKNAGYGESTPDDTARWRQHFLERYPRHE